MINSIRTSIIQYFPESIFSKLPMDKRVATIAAYAFAGLLILYACYKNISFKSRRIEEIALEEEQPVENEVENQLPAPLAEQQPRQAPVEGPQPSLPHRFGNAEDLRFNVLSNQELEQIWSTISDQEIKEFTDRLSYSAVAKENCINLFKQLNEERLSLFLTTEHFGLEKYSKSDIMQFIFENLNEQQLTLFFNQLFAKNELPHSNLIYNCMDGIHQCILIERKPLLYRHLFKCLLNRHYATNRNHLKKYLEVSRFGLGEGLRRDSALSFYKAAIQFAIASDNREELINFFIESDHWYNNAIKFISTSLEGDDLEVFKQWANTTKNGFAYGVRAYFKHNISIGW